MAVIHDISMPIFPGMPVYKDKEEKKPRIQETRGIETGVRESRFSIDSHTGTHIDAPSHMLDKGQTIEEITKFVHKAVVIDLLHVRDAIRKEHLEKEDIHEGQFVLLKTKNSFEDKFNPEFIYLDKSGAQHLADKYVAGVGIDSLGIERDDPEHQTHKILFKNNIIILEGLRLKNVEKGRYTLIAAPLNIVGCDASPVRALLIEGQI